MQAALDREGLCPHVPVHKGNNHCTAFFLVYESFVSCSVLFGL